VLRRAFDAFNEGDIELPLSLMCEDVDWPNTVEGGRLAGRDEVRAYWMRMFEIFIPQLDPLCIRALAPGKTIACGQERFIDTVTGQELAHKRFRHVYTWRGERVAHLDASEPPPAVDPADCDQTARAT
jgi:ketosteroid isomerase-like protein